MIGAGTLAALAALWFLWRMRKRRTPGGKAVAIAVVLPLLPLAANSFAWIFTEMGRQPWIVYGLQLTSARRLAECERVRGRRHSGRLHAALRSTRRGGSRPAAPSESGAAGDRGRSTGTSDVGTAHAFRVLRRRPCCMTSGSC